MKRCKHQEAVKWNPYNKVVQCHKCGQIFVLKRYKKGTESLCSKQ